MSSGQLLDGTSAIEFLKLHGNSVDIIILDMEMPGASGLEVAGYIRKHQLQLRYWSSAITIILSM